MTDFSVRSMAGMIPSFRVTMRPGMRQDTRMRHSRYSISVRYSIRCIGNVADGTRYSTVLYTVYWCCSKLCNMKLISTIYYWITIPFPSRFCTDEIQFLKCEPLDNFAQMKFKFVSNTKINFKDIKNISHLLYVWKTTFIDKRIL